jgi:hypothetical protein
VASAAPLAQPHRAARPQAARPDAGPLDEVSKAFGGLPGLSVPFVNGLL